nr:DsrE family protein [uncultured Desulfobacter sp.]
MRKVIMVLSFVCLLSVLAACGHDSANSKKLLIVVTSKDPGTQMMSMVLADRSMKRGAAVEILLCGDAGLLAIKDSEQVLLKPQNKSPQMMLKALIQNDVNVELCPIYLSNSEKSVPNLIDGVSIAKPDQVAGKLLRDDTKILSY